MFKIFCLSSVITLLISTGIYIRVTFLDNPASNEIELISRMDNLESGSVTLEITEKQFEEISKKYKTEQIDTGEYVIFSEKPYRGIIAYLNL
mgnify:CR=1 FL=1